MPVYNYNCFELFVVSAQVLFFLEILLSHTCSVALYFRTDMWLPWWGRSLPTQHLYRLFWAIPPIWHTPCVLAALAPRMRSAGSQTWWHHVPHVAESGIFWVGELMSELQPTVEHWGSLCLQLNHLLRWILFTSFGCLLSNDLVQRNVLIDRISSMPPDLIGWSSICLDG